MKKLIKLSLIVLIPFCGGFILQLAGSGNTAYAGKIIMSYGTFITAIIIFVIGMVMMAKGKLHDEETHDSDAAGRPISEINVGNSKPKKPSGEALDVSSLEEERRLEDINSSYGYESKMKYADYIAGQSANAYRNSSKKKKVLGWIYFAFLIINFTLTPLLFSFGYFLGGYICMGLFVGTLIISIIIKVIIEKTGLSGRAVRRNPEDWVIVKGTVKSCVLSSVSSTGGATRRSDLRVTNTTYKITASAEGGVYQGYSKRFYKEGDVADILISVKGDTDKMYIL